MLSLPVVTQMSQLPCWPLQWISVSWNILGINAAAHSLCLMDTLDICPGGSATLWLIIAKVGEAPASEPKLCTVVMEGLPQALPQDVELTACRLLDGDAPVALGSLTFFLPRQRNKSDCNIPTTSRGEQTYYEAV